MKKKLFTILVTLGLSISLVACGNRSLKPEEPSEVQTIFDESAALKTIAAEVTDSLAEVVDCEDYLKAMSTSPELMEILEGWKTLEVDKTRPVYVIPLGRAETEKYLKSISGEELAPSTMPENVKEYLFSRVGDTFGNMLNGRMGGASVLAASSMARYSKTFVPQKTVENQVWMLPCNDEIAVCISFSNTGNGVLTVTASYAVFNQELWEELSRMVGISLKELQW